MVENKLIITLGIVIVGLIIALGGIAFAFNYGVPWQKPIGTAPLDASGKEIPTTSIYSQANLRWSVLPTNTQTPGSGSSPTFSRLSIETIDWTQTTPFTLQVAALFLGSGTIECRADLLNNNGVAIYTVPKVTVEPFGGIFTTQPQTTKVNFRLVGYQDQDYKIKVYCRDTDPNHKNDATEKTISIHTLRA